MKTLSALLLVLALPAAAFGQSPSPEATSATSSPYPLQTCVVSGEELGSMGEPCVITFREAGKPDREVRFCCEMCQGRFHRDPAKYLAKLDAAATAAATSAPASQGQACCAGAAPAKPDCCAATADSCTRCAAKSDS